MQNKLSTIKRVIFLVENRFSRRDYQRFGVEFLLKNGFDVEVWELTPLVHPEFFRDSSCSDLFNFDGFKVFNDRQEAYSKFLNLSQGDFVVTFIDFKWPTLWFYKALSRSRINYSVYCTPPFPCSVIKKTWLHVLVGRVKAISSFRRLETWKRLFIMRLPLWCLGVRPASVIFAAGGEKCLDSKYYRFPIYKKTELLQLHALDYDLYLKEKDMSYKERPVAVFLDELYPFHPDYKMMKRSPPINTDSYFRLLNNFFDLVEEKTGLEVIIAGHPRFDYENHPDYFKGRKCIRNKTINLIKESKLVLSHSSTAINFANLFYKPVIFMTCSDLDKTYENGYIKECAKHFNKTAIYIDRNNNIDWKKELMVSKPHYDNYKRLYIKIEKSENLPFWQIVANRLKKEV